MKKILNGPTVWRAKCPVCDCEFEYDVSETIKVYDKTTLDVFRIISCPGCKTNIKHSDSVRFSIYHYRNEKRGYYDNITN